MVAFLLTAILAGNNLPASAGTLIAGKMLSKSQGVGLVIIGYVAGFLVQGGLLSTGYGAILPFPNPVFVLAAMIPALIVFVIADLIRVPLSFSIVFTMALIGIDLAAHEPFNVTYITFVIGYWIVAMLISAVLVLVSLRFSQRSVRGVRIWPMVRLIKLMILVASFLTAFTIGANTMGFLFAAIDSAVAIPGLYLTAFMIIAIAVGSITLSRGVLSRISNDIMPIRYLNSAAMQSVAILMVELGTLASIPISTTQTFTAGIYGASFSYKTRVLLLKPLAYILGTWVAAAIISLVLGFVLTSLLV